MSIPIHFEKYTLDSTLQDLPSFDISVEWNEPGRRLAELFEKQHHLPGVLIKQGDQLMGVISRDTFFQSTGRVFGVEVFFGRPIKVMLENSPRDLLILPSHYKISVAANEALRRPESTVYEPLLIRYPNQEIKLVGILPLFMIQSQLLVNYHNQRIFDTMSGLKMSDEVAIEKFINFAALPSTMDRSKLKNQYTIICMRCGQKVSYTISDVVRSYSVLSDGIRLINKMGIRYYSFNVRHQCGVNVLEIPVQHNQNFEFCALKNPSLIENYV